LTSRDPKITGVSRARPSHITHNLSVCAMRSADVAEFRPPPPAHPFLLFTCQRAPEAAFRPPPSGGEAGLYARPNNLSTTFFPPPRPTRCRVWAAAAEAGFYPITQPASSTEFLGLRLNFPKPRRPAALPFRQQAAITDQDVEWGRSKNPMGAAHRRPDYTIGQGGGRSQDPGARSG